MEVLRLQNVDAFVVFDLEDAPHNAGGTRLAPDVTEAEGALLARAMTYKFAVLGHPLGGAKGLVCANADRRETAMARYCDEIRPLVASRRFATGPDLGTYEADFTSLRPANWEPHVVNSVVDGIAFEDVLTGFGVAVAAEVALGGLDGRTVALEGFGKVGAGVAREITRRGGRVVAISTVAGCVTDPAGLDLDELWEARTAHGDQLVSELRRACLPREALFEVDADVLVPGARVGVLDKRRAARVAARAVVPAANVPYTAAGLAALGSRGIAAHADFVCNAAAVVGYTSPASASQRDVLDRVEETIGELVRACAGDTVGPFAAASAMAEQFLRTWRSPAALPPGPPLA
ncbi:MAG TPA: Glu/Leu/Phe/Val dehydrogenase dimerization domain-containing protein [Acidimicrobiia bacterium]